MTTPSRGNDGLSCYFITASTFEMQNLFRSARMAELFIEVLFHYRQQRQYLVHEFVLMPDHFHLLTTPMFSVERALQLIKGGFSSRAKKELHFNKEIWQPDSYDRLVPDLQQYEIFRDYIRSSPVHRRLAVTPEQYLYSSARQAYVLDGIPQQLKPAV